MRGRLIHELVMRFYRLEITILDWLHILADCLHWRLAA